ncbi:MAG: hypothetical protein H0X63_10890 [Flavobacteriales bacterium]|nr:hypothetical protein [Flavobacteriales bacterium]
MDIILKYRIVEKIIQIEDELVLNEIKALLGLSEKDFWEDLPEEVKESINVAKAELDKGEGVPREEVMEEVRKRYLK